MFSKSIKPSEFISFTFTPRGVVEVGYKFCRNISRAVYSFALLSRLLKVVKPHLVLRRKLEKVLTWDAGAVVLMPVPSNE